jgi:hypothetical protein
MDKSYGKYVVTDLIVPEEKQKIAAAYSKYATRILWLDENVVEGAFHMNTAWYHTAATTLEDTPHVHDADEIIGFFGGDPNNPHDLGGELDIWLEDEKITITKSALFFVPALSADSKARGSPNFPFYNCAWRPLHQRRKIG